MFQRWTAVFSRFERDERGAVAMIFGLMSVALLLLGGVAVDFARVVDMRDRISQAVDFGFPRGRSRHARGQALRRRDRDLG